MTVQLHLFPENPKPGDVPEVIDNGRWTITGEDEFPDHVHGVSVVSDDGGLVQLWIGTGARTHKFWLSAEFAERLREELAIAIEEAADFETKDD